MSHPPATSDAAWGSWPCLLLGVGGLQTVPLFWGEALHFPPQWAAHAPHAFPAWDAPSAALIRPRLPTSCPGPHPAGTAPGGKVEAQLTLRISVPCTLPQAPGTSYCSSCLLPVQLEDCPAARRRRSPRYTGRCTQNVFTNTRVLGPPQGIRLYWCAGGGLEHCGF